MRQTRICSYYPACCTRTHVSSSPVSFLSLPEDLRDWIYCEAWVDTEASLRIVQRDLPADLKEWMHNCRTDIYYLGASGEVPLYALATPIEDAYESNWKTYHNLSLSSHGVQADVARYLCSHNDILLCYHDLAELSLLRSAPSCVVRSLRSLRIHIDVASSHKASCQNSGVCCHSGWPEYPCCRNNYRHLNASWRGFEDFLVDWEKAIDSLARSVGISSLNLSLYCNTNDPSTAELIVQPLEERAFTICTISFGSNQSAVLKSIACRAVNSTMSIGSRYFHFLHLPQELRQHILGFTDLVTPTQEVVAKDNMFELPINARVENAFSCSEFCSIDYQSFPPWSCCDIPVYPSCDCWRPPTPLFLVCKEILQDSRVLFFSSNEFIIGPESKRASEHMQIPPSFFLSHVVPPTALSSLRSLDLSVSAVTSPHSDSNDCAVFEKGLSDDWVRTIDYVAPRLTRMKIKIHLDFGGFFTCENRSRELFIQAAHAWLQFYEEIVWPLQKLQYLECFSATAYWPSNRKDEQWWLEDALLRDAESRLACLAMGREAKDRISSRSIG